MNSFKCKYILVITVVLFLITTNCKTNVDEVNKLFLKEIDIKNSNVATRDYIESSILFDSLEIIPLQTKDSSLFAEINRLVVYENNLYILDKKSKAVFIFNSSGLFLRKICKLGGGPGEYFHLTDFCIDETNEKLVLYSDRPYKLLYYSLNGIFDKEFSMNQLYYSFIIKNTTNVFYTPLEDYSLLLSNIKTKESVNYIKNKDYSKNMNHGAIGSLIKSSDIYFMNPYSTDIYKILENNVEESYHINIGDQFIDEFTIKRINSPGGIVKYCLKYKKVYSISSFRENRNYISFGMEPSGRICVFSKKNKQSYVFVGIIDSKLNLHFHNYIGHDGNDDNLFLYIHASEFKRAVNTIKDNNIKITALYKKIKNISDQLDINNNHVLLKYHFK